MDPLGKATINTDRFSSSLRTRLIDNQGRLLISSFNGSDQTEDLSEPPNCDDLGRIRHFRRGASPGWPANPLPIDPAARALKLPCPDELEAEVFQLGGCNWRCWYCYVPFDRLSANDATGRWISPDALVGKYAALPNRPRVLVLSGGQPDLVPEWLPETIVALQRRGLETVCYLWIDDNLSNDYYWKYLSEKQRGLIQRSRMVGRVGCFKGFDPRSFAFNTQADPALFDRQFELFERLVQAGLDVYGYVTLTSDSERGVEEAIPQLIDRLQSISTELPLRVVPLEIREFSPLIRRVTAEQFTLADRVQHVAVQVWNQEIDHRFPAMSRAASICDIKL